MRSAITSHPPIPEDELLRLRRIYAPTWKEHARRMLSHFNAENFGSPDEVYQNQPARTSARIDFDEDAMRNNTLQY